MDRQEIRRAMGPETWDTLEPHLMDSFLDHYDTLCEALYFGDSSGLEEVMVHKGGSKEESYTFKDHRLYPIKAEVDSYLRRTARAFRAWNGKRRGKIAPTSLKAGMPKVRDAFYGANHDQVVTTLQRDLRKITNYLTLALDATDVVPILGNRYRTIHRPQQQKEA